RDGGGVTGVEQRFGPYGGRYVPETLIPALDELEAAWLEARDDPGFQLELSRLLRDYAGRPTPLYHAGRLSEAAGRDLYLRRADAQGGRQRGDSRLGCERGEHPLRDRVRGGAVAIPSASAGSPARDRRRGARAVPRPHRPAAGPGHRLRGRRVQRARHFRGLR